MLQNQITSKAVSDQVIFRRTAQRMRMGSKVRARKAGLSPKTGITERDWQQDDHWSTVLCHLASMQVPNEG